MSILRFISSLGLDGEACFIIRRCSILRIIIRAVITIFVSASVRVFRRVLGGL